MEAAGFSTRVFGDPEGTLIVELTGELDANVEVEAFNALAEAERSCARRVIIDLDRLTFIDSTGVCFLLRARKQAVAGGYEVIFRFLDNRRVKRIIDLSGLTHVLAGP